MKDWIGTIAVTVATGAVIIIRPEVSPWITVVGTAFIVCDTLKKIFGRK